MYYNLPYRLQNNSSNSQPKAVVYRFTTVVKGGLLYSGRGVISVAGGDQVWLAVNKTLLLELSTDPDDVTVPCMTVDISAASGEGASVMLLFQEILFSFQ